MTTTSDDILLSLDGARDALVTAINAKGGSLAQDSTLYQCANAVNEISTGTDTSDATATASDILQDKTAYAKDEKITGTIPTVTASMSDNVVTVPKGYVKSAQTLTVGTTLNAYTITPAANAQVISKGSYLKGEVTVAGDANLTTSNIKSGVTIFNVAGTYEGESTGGTSAEYYKCASVSSGASQPEGYTLSMVTTLDDPSYKKFDFTMEDPSKTGNERRWFTSDGLYRLSIGTSYDLSPVCIIDLIERIDDTIDEIRLFSAPAGYANPWDATTWIDEMSGMSEFDVSWTVSPAVSGGSTWSGYKAVFDSGTGTWSFESDVTAGLTYTSVTPIVGGIYSPDALVTVSMLYDGTVTLPGCVFYAELKDNTSELKSGQTLTIPSSATFQTIGGVQCVQLNGTDQITFTP